MSIPNFSEAEDKDEEPIATFAYMKKLNNALQVYELEETNEFLNNVVKQFKAKTERSREVDKITRGICKWKESEVRKMNGIKAELISKINYLRNRYNEDYSKYNGSDDRLKTLNEGVKTHLRTLYNKLKTAIKTEKGIREECNKLREKEETYKAREQELNNAVRKTEETKEMFDKIAKNLNIKHLSDFAPSKYDLYRKDSSSKIASDGSSSVLDCIKANQVKQKTFKYRGQQSTYNIEKGSTYRNLKRTRTSITFTDSISVTDDKRKKNMA